MSQDSEKRGSRDKGTRALLAAIWMANGAHVESHVISARAAQLDGQNRGPGIVRSPLPPA